MSEALREIMGLLDVTARAIGARSDQHDMAAIRHETTSGSDARAMLMAQARTLDALFAGLLQRAAGAQHVEQVEGFMRVALRAQAQSVKTLQAAAGLGMPGHLAVVQVNQGTHLPQNELSGGRRVVQADGGTQSDAG